MNLIVRILGYLVLGILNLLGVLLATIFRFLLLPILIGLFLVLRRLIIFSFTAFVNGPRQYIDRLAGEWTERIHEGADNRNHIYQIFQLCRFIVGTIVVLGWIVSTLFTLIILRVVFAFFI